MLFLIQMVLLETVQILGNVLVASALISAFLRANVMYVLSYQAMLKGVTLPLRHQSVTQILRHQEYKIQRLVKLPNVLPAKNQVNILKYFYYHRITRIFH